MQRRFSIVFFTLVLALLLMPQRASAITECCCRYTNGVNTGTCESLDRAVDETCASYKNSQEWKTSDNANLCSTSTSKPQPKKKNPIIFIPNVTIPGSDIFVTGGRVTVNGRFIGDYVSAIYSFFAGVIGMIAAVMVLFGGFQWMTAGGNAGNVQKAKTTITSSLIAIVLTLGSYLLLYTINPQLVQIRDLPLTIIPPIEDILVPDSTTGATATGCAGNSCIPLRNSGLQCKAAKDQPGGIDSCFAARGMVNTLNCLKQKGAPAFTVTEAMPATVTHQSSCHKNGCCVDTIVNSGTCDDVALLLDAVTECGATAANEYVAASCPGAKGYETTTGNNVHINSAPGDGC